MRASSADPAPSTAHGKNTKARNHDHGPDTDQSLDPGMHPFHSPKASSSDLLAGQVAADSKEHLVSSEILRISDFNVKPGVPMHTTDCQDLQWSPESTAIATGIAIPNAAHLARLPKARPYPAG
ncbi:hypothetical protein BZG24_29320 [Escherichia coli]|nr:hypothetical protein [Escherichia coli]